MIYKPGKHVGFGKEKAQRYGERIAVLEEENGGLFPELLVEDAIKEDSPLHDWFEWDDKRAARRHRIEQAEYLLRSIVVEVESPGGAQEVRAFHVIKVDEDDKTNDGRDMQRGRYVSIQNVLAEPDHRRQLVENALRELEIWKNKYKQYQELVLAIETIDKILEQKEAILFESSRS